VVSDYGIDLRPGPFSHPMQNAPARMSLPDRRQSAGIHTGGMRGPQHGQVKWQVKMASKMPKMASEMPTGADPACFEATACRLTPRQPCRGLHGRSCTAFGKPEFGGSDYARGASVRSRLSIETARDISPKQAAAAINDDQNATQSRAGMTFSSSAGWVT
jgi:hypothetical protein